jgi:DNA invertase Pin-like site-specific DNA recombinase
MLVGYARTSTADQEAGLAAQERDLTAVGCDRVFSEQISATATQRPKLVEALEFVRMGDSLVVTKPDRLARSVADLLALVEGLTKRGVGLRVLSMGGAELDTNTPTGKLTLTMLGAVAEFERALMLERQREGIAAAKAAGKYQGRAPTVQKQAAEMLELRRQGVGPAEIARRLGVARSSVYRVLKGGVADA